MTDVSGTGGHSVADGPRSRQSVPFVIVPKWIQSLGWKALLAYHALAAGANRDTSESRTPQPKLADMVGVSVTTMREGIAELVAAGAVEIVPEYHPDTGSRMPNLYVLAFDPPLATHQAPPSQGDGAPLAGRGAIRPQEVRPQEVQPTVAHAEKPPRPEVTELCALLATHVEAVTGARPVVTKTWERDMRLTLERPRGTGDPWTAEQVEYVIRWLGREGERSQFWSVNVRCPSKLRAQMDRLVLEIRSERRGPSQASRIERIRNLDPSTLQAGNPFERALAKARGQVTA